MANSIPDIILTGAWQNAYALSGFTVGSSIIVQNKSSLPVLAYISVNTPSADSKDGWVIGPNSAFIVDAGEGGCWVRGNGPVNIQQG